MAVSRKLLLLVPLVYAALIGLFLWLHLASGKPFVESVSGLQIRGVRASGAAGSGVSVKRITLSYGAAEFRFSRLRPLLLGQSRARLRPVSCAVSADGAAVRLRGLGGRDLTVVFRVDSGGSLEVSVGTAEPLALPLESPGARIEVADAVPAVGITRGEERLVAVLPQGSRLRWTGGYLYLSGPAARLRLSRSSGGSLLMQWFLAQGSLVGQEDYDREVSGYRERAYQAWTGSRYQPDMGLWRGADGQLGYSGRLGSAIAAEAIARGEYERALALVLKAEDVWTRVRPTAAPTHEASPFTGNTGAFAAWRADEQGPAAREAERLLRAGNLAAWRIPNLVGLLESAGAGAVLAETGERSLAGWDPDQTDAATALGVLEVSLDAARTPWLAAAGERALSRVLASLRIEGEALGMVSGDKVDPMLSLRAGALLARAGSAQQNQALAGLGRTLIATVLRAADAEGFVAAPAGRVPAEEVYHLVRMSPYLPALRPLTDLFGPGVWMWSAAPLRSSAVAGNEVTLAFGFAPGVPHHVFVQGLPQFTQLRIRGIPWRADPAYARYFAGWFHDAGGRTLTLKLTQDQAEEPVVIVR